MTTFDPREFLTRLSELPGVYRMYGEKRELLYVGKARNLRKRVSSYFTRTPSSLRIGNMVRQIRDIEVTVTHTEAEALLLESNLIKRHHPRYNILLRDDKSYPYIFVSTEESYPSLVFHRGAKRRPGRYFGPYPSSSAVRFTLHHLQKVFRVRQCEESYFRNRSRPCLQYQIKRCSAPCVGAISEEEYGRDVADSIAFLEGKSEEIVQQRVARMEAAAAHLEFERAAQYRDQIEMLRRITQQQYVSGAKGDVDVVACAISAGTACVQVFYIRGGSSLGNRSFFPRLPDSNLSSSDVLGAFLGQYYASREIPVDIIVNAAIEDREVLEEMLTQRKGSRVHLRANVRGDRAHWLAMAQRNARTALASHLRSRESQRHRLEALVQALDLEAVPHRMECFDISHTQGEATVASCVVFNEEGPLTSDYRRFNITGITPGDDYAAMHRVLHRRYKRLMAEEGAPLPDILFIDGGRGQLREAGKVLASLQVQGVTIIGVAKGEGRKPGLETLFVQGRAAGVQLDENSPALHLVQQIRDEAHRFAITGHRRKRAKRRVTSTLESIAGLGPKRRQQLLKQFGGIRGVSNASVEELAKVPGISVKLAERIHAVYHPDTI